MTDRDDPRLQHTLSDSMAFQDHPDFQVDEPADPDPTLGVPSEPAPAIPGPLEGLEATLAEPGPAESPAVPFAAPEAIELALDATLVGGPLEDDASFAAPPTPPAGAQPPAAVEQAPVASERFELLGVLGEGGMGKVFRARDRQIEGRKVALKVLHPRFSKDPRFRELFFQEIRAAQGFVSEHAVQIRDTGTLPDGALFLTMDLVAGESLRRKLRREGVLQPAHAFEIARQVLLGLQSGHEHGLVHRDVKPTNVMLAARVPKTAENPYGVHVRVLDFGIAGLVEEQTEGQRRGTPKYMSPEQVQGQRLDARSVLFAVGVVLYEMLSGARPFEGDTLQEVETAILETQVKPLIQDLGGLPRPVRKVLQRALQKDREKRFQSAGEFLTALDRARQHLTTSSTGLATKVGLALFASIAGSEGMWIYQQRQKEQVTAQEHRQELDDAARESQEAQASLQLALTQRESEADRLREELAQDGDLRTRIEDLQRDYDGLLEENRTLTRRGEELERRTEELRSARFRERPEAKTAATFDEVLRRIELGAGLSAVEYLNDREKLGVFAAENVEGRPLVRQLAAAAAAVESARTPEGVDLALLTTASTLLAKLEAGREDFSRQATGWLELQEAGEEPVDRIARLGRLTTELGAEIDTLRQQSVSSQESDWEAVAAGPDDQDPQAAFNHAALYGAEAITPLVERYAEHLDHTLVHDGHLDPQALALASQLPAWGAWLAELGATLEGDAADRLRGFVCAHAWYVERASTLPFPELFAALPSLTQTAPHHDWRARLALQVALARATTYPLPALCDAVMRHTWSASDSTLWFHERQQSSNNGTWEIERRIHDLAGRSTGRPQAYVVTREDDAFFTAGIKGLDLRAADANLRVALHEPGDPTVLPPKPWVRGLDFQAYQDFAQQGAIPCLVVQNGDSELWFSPQVGLVREARAGTYERELVFFGTPR